MQRVSRGRIEWVREPAVGLNADREPAGELNRLSEPTVGLNGDITNATVLD